MSQVFDVPLSSSCHKDAKSTAPSVKIFGVRCDICRKSLKLTCLQSLSFRCQLSSTKCHRFASCSRPNIVNLSVDMFLAIYVKSQFVSVKIIAESVRCKIQFRKLFTPCVKIDSVLRSDPYHHNHCKST